MSRLMNLSRCFYIMIILMLSSIECTASQQKLSKGFQVDSQSIYLSRLAETTILDILLSELTKEECLDLLQLQDEKERADIIFATPDEIGGLIFAGALCGCYWLVIKGIECYKKYVVGKQKKPY